MNKTEHMRKRFARQSELLRERFKGLKLDPDIWNLEYMIT